MGFSIQPSSPADVAGLFAAADAYALSIYPPEHYHALDVAEFERDDVLLLVARAEGGDALGMAALVPGAGAAELKRMFVSPAARGAGVGRALLEAVEAAALARGIQTLRLETGEPQAAAIALYTRAGYRRIEAFGEYVHDPTSVCMEKLLTRSA